MKCTRLILYDLVCGWSALAVWECASKYGDYKRVNVVRFSFANRWSFACSLYRYWTISHVYSYTFFYFIPINEDDDHWSRIMVITSPVCLALIPALSPYLRYGTFRLITALMLFKNSFHHNFLISLYHNRNFGPRDEEHGKILLFIFLVGFKDLLLSTCTFFEKWSGTG